MRILYVTEKMNKTIFEIFTAKFTQYSINKTRMQLPRIDILKNWLTQDREVDVLSMERNQNDDDDQNYNFRLINIFYKDHKA